MTEEERAALYKHLPGCAPLVEKRSYPLILCIGACACPCMGGARGGLVSATPCPKLGTGPSPPKVDENDIVELIC